MSEIFLARLSRVSVLTILYAADWKRKVGTVIAEILSKNSRDH